MRRFLGAFTILSALSGCVTTQQDLTLPETTKYPLARGVPEPVQPTWTHADGTLAGAAPSEATALTPPPGLLPAEYRNGVGVTVAARPDDTSAQTGVTSGTTPAGMPMAVAGGATAIPVQVAQNPNGPYSGSAIQPVGLTQPAPFYPPAGGANPASSSRDIPFQPTFTDLPHSQPVSNLKPLVPLPVRQATPPILSPAITTGNNPNIIEVDPGNGGGVSPTIRMVNSKRFTLNYEIRDIGSSGVTTVDLWCTRDTRSWKRYETAYQHQHTHIVEVREEGLYGFTLVARSGAGLSKDAPKAGDQPQIWVMVDLTRPVVNLEGVEISLMAKSPSLVIRWNAQDRNFASRPITLLTADQATGPWTPIASALENTGRFEWVPPGAPHRAFLRVEAVDQAGNIGAADTSAPIRLDIPWSASTSSTGPESAHNVIQQVVDQVRPSISILGVESRDR